MTKVVCDASCPVCGADFPHRVTDNILQCVVCMTTDSVKAFRRKEKDVGEVINIPQMDELAKAFIAVRDATVNNMENISPAEAIALLEVVKAEIVKTWFDSNPDLDGSA